MDLFRGLGALRLGLGLRLRLASPSPSPWPRYGAGVSTEMSEKPCSSSRIRFARTCPGLDAPGTCDAALMRMQAQKQRGRTLVVA
jgi:hypothetical protein